jgi:hypothetical protein
MEVPHQAYVHRTGVVDRMRPQAGVRSVVVAHFVFDQTHQHILGYEALWEEVGNLQLAVGHLSGQVKCEEAILNLLVGARAFAVQVAGYALAARVARIEEQNMVVERYAEALL